MDTITVVWSFHGSTVERIVFDNALSARNYARQSRAYTSTPIGSSTDIKLVLTYPNRREC